MITLPQGSSVIIKTEQAGVEVDMISTLSALSPVLSTPSFLMMIRNTTATISKDANGSTIYRYAVKATSQVAIQYDETQKKHVIITDPRSTEFMEMEMGVVRINPKYVFQKYRNLSWDSNISTLSGVVGQYTQSFIVVRQNEKSIEAFDLMKLAANAVTIEGNPTTFANGAHVETRLITGTPEEKAQLGYDAIADLRASIIRLGLSTAIGKENQDYKHSVGTTVRDWVVFNDAKFDSNIKQHVGLINSIPGFEAFQTFGFQAILGLPTYISPQLPQDVHFMAVTAGIQGTIGYEMVGDKLGGRIYMDPDFPTGYRLALYDNYSLGVVYPFQIYILKKPEISIEISPSNIEAFLISSNKIDKSKESTDPANVKPSAFTDTIGTIDNVTVSFSKWDMTIPGEITYTALLFSPDYAQHIYTDIIIEGFATSFKKK